jgi:SAM-dependent methyltransferase
MSDFLNPKLSSPFYFIRTGLFNAATTFSGYTKGGRLLDFGCGSKPYRSLFKVDEYIGLDYENEGHPHNEEQIDIFYDGGKLPFKDAEFDYILCTEVFEHLFDLDDKIGEFNRVLKKNGLLFVTCPFVWNEHEIPYDFARYTSFALNHKFKNKGFEVVSYKKGGTFFETYTQTFFLYFSRKDTRYKSEKIGLFKKCVIFTINVFGKILNRLLPNNDSLYLSNIYVVKKTEDLI